MNLSSYVRKGRFYQAVVDDGSDIIFVVDYEGAILYHNRSVKDTLGYRARSLLGKNFLDFIHPGQAAEIRKKFKACTRKSYAAGVEFRFRCKDGSFRFLEFNSINLRNKNKIPGLILDCRDITQRKKDAEELMRAQQARQLFLANVSHEIRTPINGIAGMVTLLHQLPQTDEQTTYLNAIKSSAENLKVIINDILDLASIESGKLKFERIGFSLSDLLKNLQDQYQVQAQQRGLELLLEKAFDGHPILIGDPVRLNQILVNLLSNAIKFTPAGYIVLRCEVVPKGKNHWAARFIVKDTGIGIPKDKLQTIFESFSQADASITRKFGGTGLGLTIVKQLVELQQGSITVSSRENAGSEFTVQLRYQRGATDDLPDAVQANHTAQPFNLPGLRVLLVEDNDINQLYAGSVLKTMNCQYEVAENGYVALEKLKSAPFDLVLMDIQMPFMDGFEATKAIRSTEGLQRLPVVALTANASPAERAKCLRVGMSDCVSKPFTPAELFGVLKKFLTKPTGGKTQNTEPARSKPGRINLKYLERVSHGDSAFIEQMIDTIRDSLPRSAQELRNAQKEKDTAAVARILHRLKPSFDMLGTTDLRATALMLEECMLQGKQFAVMEDQLTHFLTSLERLAAELAAFRAPHN
jgi:PAS domain S-box-containing protein